MKSAQKLLSELVALPSVNPAFGPAGTSWTGEHRVADFIAGVARRSGMDVDFQKVFSGRSNVLARLTPRDQIQRRILLAPHLDTVAVGAATQFIPRVKDGKLHGRGACDTKGSIAAMLTALGAICKSGQRPRHTEIVFAGLVDEENAQAGSRALVASRFTADLAIVGEPTRLQAVTAHKGNLWLRLETQGKASHGARPELGRNAVHEMARIVDLLQTTYADRLRRRKHPLLGCATISVGTIAGGTQPNIVPDRCVISADRRTLPGETEASVRIEVKKLLRQFGLNAAIADSKTDPCLPMETEWNTPLVREFLRCVRQKKPVGVHYFCDASVLSHGGVPSVVFGPGDIAQAHTSDEWISLRSLERSTAMLISFLRAQP